MTRFARAKGSKASNLKAPEDSTPWEVMKEHLLKAKHENEETKKREEAEQQRIDNYNNFLKEQRVQKRKATWCDFPETESNAISNSKANKSKGIEGKKNKLSKQPEQGNSEVNNSHNSNDIHNKDSEVPKKKKKKHNKNNKTSHEDNNENGLTQSEEQSVSNSENKKKHNKNNTATHKDHKENVDSPSQEQSISSNKKKKKNKKKQKAAQNASEINSNDTPSKTVQNITNGESGPVKKIKNKKNKKSSPESKTDETSNEQSTTTGTDKPEKQTVSPKKVKNKRTKNSKPNRRKPIDDKSFHLIINGKEVQLVRFDGFPIMKKDAERLEELKKSMIKKGIPKSEVQRTMKLERRRAEKALARVKRDVCYNCRKGGHNLSDCPDLKSNIPGIDAAEGVCFKCGSTEHRQFECKVQRDKEFRFATCFICKESGHIARQCPDNPKGLYPNGGCCKLCGDVTHLRKDCPTVKDKKEETSIKLQTLNDDNIEDIGFQPKSTPQETSKKPKKIKF